jgi:hypothetical protein
MLRMLLWAKASRDNLLAGVCFEGLGLCGVIRCLGMPRMARGQRLRGMNCIGLGPRVCSEAGSSAILLGVVFVFFTGRCKKE